MKLRDKYKTTVYVQTPAEIMLLGADSLLVEQGEEGPENLFKFEGNGMRRAAGALSCAGFSPEGNPEGVWTKDPENRSLACFLVCFDKLLEG